MARSGLGLKHSFTHIYLSTIVSKKWGGAIQKQESFVVRIKNGKMSQGRERGGRDFAPGMARPTRLTLRMV